MIEKLISRISLYFFNDLYIDFDEIADFQYALEAILSSVYCLGLAFLLCSILGYAQYGLFFILFLSVIKMCFQSYHAPTRRSCCMIYNSLVLGNLFIYINGYEYIASISVTIPFVILALIVVAVYKELTKISVFVLLSYAVLILFTSTYQTTLYVILMLALVSEWFLVMMKHIKVPTN